MGGAGWKKKGSNSARGSMTLREESTGKTHGNVNAKTMSKTDHLKELALWAGPEAPSLGAFFGERLAATKEAMGFAVTHFFYVCERCESILQPGNNCTVRIEKEQSKGRRRKRSNPTVENNIVYRCHFCFHQNLKRGTPTGYMKATLNLKKTRDNHPSSGCRKVESGALLPLDGQKLEAKYPATPLSTTGLSLLDSKRRKRNRSGAKTVGEPHISSVAEDMEKSIHASSKRRKQSWTSLKEIAESSGQYIGNKFTDLNNSPMVCDSQPNFLLGISTNSVWNFGLKAKEQS